MSAALVLQDAALAAGLGLAPTQDLALWASGVGGELGSLGAMALEGSAVQKPHLCEPWNNDGYQTRGNLRSRFSSRVSRCLGSRTCSGTDFDSMPWSSTESRSDSGGALWSVARSGVSA